MTEEYGNDVDMLWTCSPFTIKKLIKRDKCHQWGPGEHSRRTTGIGEHPLCAGLFKMVLRQKNTVYNIYIYTVQISTVYKALCLHLKKRVHVICAFGVHHTSVLTQTALTQALVSMLARNPTVPAVDELTPNT